ncbi:1-Acyl-Sn-Glycerol-3-Phosphate acyltransferase [Arthrobacter sp. Hiyo8]|nr:1-Acyl-Sn-Glycerol-3-Phosphate acyltransferase [Arthrobacter sp. Hiyo8]
MGFFAKAEYFTTKGFKGRAMKAFFQAVGSIPVERGEQAASVQALKTLLDILENGRASASIRRGPARATACSTAGGPVSAGLP